MDEIIIRRSEPADIPRIKQIYESESVLAQLMQLPHPSEQLWESRLAKLPDTSHSLIACVGNQVVGHIVLHGDTLARRRHVGKLGLAVHEDHQSKGIGRAMLDAVINLADNWLNLARIELTVYTDNTPAIKLYQAAGFVTEGTAAAYGFKNGRLASVHFMARIKDEAKT